MNRYRSTLNLPGHPRYTIAEYPDDARTAVLVGTGVLQPVETRLTEPLEDQPPVAVADFLAEAGVTPGPPIAPDELTEPLPEETIDVGIVRDATDGTITGFVDPPDADEGPASVPETPAEVPPPVDPPADA